MSNVTAHNTRCLEIYCHCSLVSYKTYVLQLLQLNTSVLSNTETHSYATHHPPPPQQQQQQPSPSSSLLILHT